MTDNINLIKTSSSVEPSFSWSPADTHTFTLHTGDVVVPAALANTFLTFTATVGIFDPTGLLSIVEYRWDFGDGTQAFGQSIGHTYVVANFDAFTVLRVRDNLGRFWYSRQQMYLH